jgi:CBS domain-containing protein
VSAAKSSSMMRGRVCAQPIGLITEADILDTVGDGKDVNDVRIHVLMTSELTFGSPATTIHDAA